MSPKPKIILTRRWTDEVERYLSQAFDVQLNSTDQPMSAVQLTEALRQCDALCSTVTDALTADVLEAPGRRARFIGNFGVGFSHIDIEAARRQGLRVSNTPDVLTDATAEIAILLLLMITRRASEAERELRAGQWHGWRPTHMMGQSLAGKTLGLVGFGRIAQATARKAQAAFGMRIAYNSRHRADAVVEQQCNAQYFESLEELVSSCDAISLHCPGGPATHHLFNAKILAHMKPTAVLINTARGTVVDEIELVAALSARRIAGAGLDVYEKEPRLHPGLLSLPNVALLPHLGSATIETRTAMGMRVARNLEAFFAGQALPDPVV